MKASVLYYSKSGNTKTMAETIVEGMQAVEGVEAQAFSIEEVDVEFVKESSCVVLGSPTYYADIAAPVKVWLEKSAGPCKITGKLGGAFATADYIHGGGDMGVQNILKHMMVYGMITYSGGGAYGVPVIHLGPVALNKALDDSKDTFFEYGKRMAGKAKEIFG